MVIPGVKTYNFFLNQNLKLPQWDYVPSTNNQNFVIVVQQTIVQMHWITKKGKWKKSEGKFNLNDKFNNKCKQKICNFCEGYRMRCSFKYPNIVIRLKLWDCNIKKRLGRFLHVMKFEQKLPFECTIKKRQTNSIINYELINMFGIALYNIYNVEDVYS